MNAFLGSLKADLLDRRVLPLLALAGVALVAALAYAVLGGSSSTAPSSPVASPPVSPAGPLGISVSQAPSAARAAAETTSGSALQRGGAARNPFTPLHVAKAAAAAPASKAATPASGSASGSSGSSGAGGTPPSPAPEAKPSPPKQPQTVYHVAVLFGETPQGAATPSSQLTPYQSLKREQPLPSAKRALVVFRGVTAGAKSATFTLVGEAILRGKGTCLPSATQCQAIDLKAGASEELEYLPPSGASVIYRLQVVNITSTKASGAAAAAAYGGESRAGRRLLRRFGLSALPGLRYSALKGVLVFASRASAGARAHTAAQPRARR